MTLLRQKPQKGLRPFAQGLRGNQPGLVLATQVIFLDSIFLLGRLQSKKFEHLEETVGVSENRTTPQKRVVVLFKRTRLLNQTPTSSFHDRLEHVNLGRARNPWNFSYNPLIS